MTRESQPPFHDVRWHALPEWEPPADTLLLVWRGNYLLASYKDGQWWGGEDGWPVKESVTRWSYLLPDPTTTEQDEHP